MSKNSIMKKEASGLLSIEDKTSSKANEMHTTIELPSLEGDMQFYLGQTIVTLIRLSIENDNCYSKEMQRGFKVELMASVLAELNISLDDIAKVYQDRKVIEE